MSFLGCLSIGAAFGVAISPYIAIPLVMLNAKVIAAAFGSDLSPLIAFGNLPIEKMFSRSSYGGAIERKDDAA
jgi:hypothetical protein